MEISVTPLVSTGGHFNLFLPSGFDMEIVYPGFPKGRCDGPLEVLKKTREIKRAGADFIKWGSLNNKHISRLSSVQC